MVVTSNSMIPILKLNDLLIVEKSTIDKVMVDDIIVFNSHVEEFGIVAHRAIEKFDDNGKIAIHTQGDNVDEVDAWIVHEEDFIGKMEGSISYIGILLVDPVRYTLVIIIIITAISLLHEITSETKLQKTNNLTKLKNYRHFNMIKCHKLLKIIVARFSPTGLISVLIPIFPNSSCSTNSVTGILCHPYFGADASMIFSTNDEESYSL